MTGALENQNLCRCGRPLGIHCPECGSPSKFPKARNGYNKVDSATMQIVHVRGFICRYCGRNYDEVMECCAPALPVHPTMLSKKQADAAAENFQKSLEEARARGGEAEYNRVFEEHKAKLIEIMKQRSMSIDELVKEKQKRKVASKTPSSIEQDHDAGWMDTWPPQEPKDE